MMLSHVSRRQVLGGAAGALAVLQAPLFVGTAQATLTQAFVTRYRAAVTTFLHSWEALQAMRTEYDALNIGGILSAGDLSGTNVDIAVSHFTLAVWSVGTLNSAFVTGHNTNLYRLKV